MSDYIDIRAAELSGDQKHRYSLRRQWALGDDSRILCWVMLNPSTADALADDATIRSCCRLARVWGFVGIDVANLFPFRTRFPLELYRASEADRIGEHAKANAPLDHMACRGQTVVAGWGLNGARKPYQKRIREVVDLFTVKHRSTLFCWDLTKGGQPQHPLYAPSTAVLKPWRTPQ